MVWGGLHGVYLAAERFLRERFGGAEIAKTWGFRLGLGLLTYFLVNLTWVFFRAQDFPTAWRLVRSMLLLEPGGELVLASFDMILVSVITVGMLVVHWTMRNRRLEHVVARAPWWLTAVVWGVMLFLIIITQGSGDAFIYFQF